MSLVERFIEINGWTTSRKTALLMGLLLPSQLIVSAIAHVFAASTQLVDMALFDCALAAGVLVPALCLAMSLLATRAGKEGRWTVFLLIVLYGAWITVFVQMLGSWSTIFWAFFPMSVFIVVLYYGERAGWFAFIYGIFMVTGREVLEAKGILGYAPAMLNRTLDGQSNLDWVIAISVFVAVFYAFCFVTSMLAVAGRKLQDDRLLLAQRLIRRYVPTQLADEIVRGEHAQTFSPKRARLTIFFSDVEGFTDASDQLDAEDLASILNEYLAEMSAIAERYGATINQFVGDGIMIFFGAPQATSDKDHALRAVRMAQGMQQRLLELKGAWEQRGIRKPFRARIGINTGHASVGDFGSEDRKVYSAIGIQTNIAARVQAHCQPGKVLISDATWALVHDDIPCTDKGELQLKGVHYPVRVYEVGETADAVPASS